jgi:hypothetical protein
LQSANLGNEKPSCQKAESANFPEENTRGSKSPSQTRLGIPIFGSDFWDPHRKRDSGSVSDSKDSGQKNFNQIPLLKNREIGKIEKSEF